MHISSVVLRRFKHAFPPDLDSTTNVPNKPHMVPLTVKSSPTSLSYYKFWTNGIQREEVLGWLRKRGYIPERKAQWRGGDSCAPSKTSELCSKSCSHYRQFEALRPTYLYINYAGKLLRKLEFKSTWTSSRKMKDHLQRYRWNDTEVHKETACTEDLLFLVLFIAHTFFSFRTRYNLLI